MGPRRFFWPQILQSNSIGLEGWLVKALTGY